jgi:hypothetical protein
MMKKGKRVAQEGNRRAIYALKRPTGLFGFKLKCSCSSFIHLFGTATAGTGYRNDLAEERGLQSQKPHLTNLSTR